LREKVRLHGESEAHKDAQKVVDAHSHHALQNTVSKAHALFITLRSFVRSLLAEVQPTLDPSAETI